MTLSNDPSDLVRDARADPVSLTVATYDRVAGDFARRHGDPNILAEARARFAGHVAGTAPPDRFRILDAGCGPGRDSAWFSERGFPVVGVDLSEGMLAEARRRAPGATFQRADVRALDFPAASFDGVWCSASLLHLDRSDVPSVLRSFARLLGHGWLWLTVKAGKGEEITDRIYGAGNPRRFTYFNRFEIELAVERAGFEVREVSDAPIGEETHPWIAVLAQTALQPPLVAASAVIFDPAGRVLLSERTDGRGWNLPAGFVDRDEGPRGGIVREVKEETGLDVEVVQLVGVYDWPRHHRGDTRHLVSHCFLCRIIGGSLIPTNEALQHGWFSPERLPTPMSSPRHQVMILDARARRDGSGEVAYRSER